MIIVETSLAVSPANTLPLYAKQNNITLIEINPENTELLEEMNETIRNTSVETLPKLISLFKKNKLYLRKNIINFDIRRIFSIINR